MSTPDETPAEARTRALLGDLRESTPAAPDLPAAIAHTARWQRPVRRVLLGAATAGSGLADGLAGLLRGRRRP